MTLVRLYLDYFSSFFSSLFVEGFTKALNQYSVSFAASVTNSLYISIQYIMKSCHKANPVVNGVRPLRRSLLFCPIFSSCSDCGRSGSSCSFDLLISSTALRPDSPVSVNVDIFSADIGGLNSILFGGFTITSTSGL